MNDTKDVKSLKSLVLAGGCFWCTEAVFSRLRGVISVKPGYAGGSEKDSSYTRVSSGTTGHAEAVKIEYDSSVISYSDLLKVFFATHDPTTLNRQGADTGSQYRSAIFYNNEEEKKQAKNCIQKLEADKVFDKPIVTALEPLIDFYEAEDYHHDYYEKNTTQPYCQAVISPKVAKLRKEFQSLLKKE